MENPKKILYLVIHIVMKSNIKKNTYSFESVTDEMDKDIIHRLFKLGSKRVSDDELTDLNNKNEIK